MMNNIKTIALTVMSLAMFASCNQKQAKETPAPKVQTQAVHPECLLGDSITKLVQNGVVEFSAQEGTKFSLIDKMFANVRFPEVGINYYRGQYDKVRNVCYGATINVKDVNARYIQIKAYMVDRYGEPTKETRYYSDDGVAKFTEALWNKGFFAIALSTTEPLQEENGSVIIVFTISEDIPVFSVYFK